MQPKLHLLEIRSFGVFIHIRHTPTELLSENTTCNFQEPSTRSLLKITHACELINALFKDNLHETSFQNLKSLLKSIDASLF